MSVPSARRQLVPSFVVAAFADAGGQVMAERRDRSRRRIVSARQAVEELGFYVVAGEGDAARDLARLLAGIEAQAARVIPGMLAGGFPPRGEDRACLALFLGMQLVVGRGHRAALRWTAGMLGRVIEASLQELAGGEAAEAAAEAPGAAVEGEDPPHAVAAALEPEPGPAQVVVHDGEPVRVDVTRGLRAARLLAARTWQLVRFPRPVLLTGDTPVVLWGSPARGLPYPTGLGRADEARFPLDPRHALIVARKAPAGEVVRDLGERHARALNRTLAERAQEWMYYHPESDPLEGVELASP